MKGRDTLVEYESQSGEKIKVLCGPRVKHGFQKHFRQFTTRVYVNRKLIEEYFFRNRDMNMSMIPELSFRLEQLAENGADSDEIVATINNLISSENENEKHKIDNMGAYWLTADKQREIASSTHQMYFASGKRSTYPFLHIL